MAKTKKGELPKPTEDIRVEKPVFKDTLAKMIKKKPPEPPKESKN